MKRPVFITIIAWYMIIGVILGVLDLLLLLHYPTHMHYISAELQKSKLPVSSFYLISGAKLAISFISGIGILKAQDWSRYLYAISNLLITFITMIAFPNLHTNPLVTSVLIIIIGGLFNTRANSYFKQAVNQM